MDMMILKSFGWFAAISVKVKGKKQRDFHNLIQL